MSSVIAGAVHVWPWIAGGSAAIGAIWRWWRGRAPGRSSIPRWDDTEQILFPGDGTAPKPLRGVARWLSAPLLLTLKEAGDDAIAEEMAGIRADLKRALADNSRLRAELDSRIASDAGSSATDMEKNQPSRPSRPRSPRSGS